MCLRESRDAPGLDIIYPPGLQVSKLSSDWAYHYYIKLASDWSILLMLASDWLIFIIIASYFGQDPGRLIEALAADGGQDPGTERLETISDF